MEGSVPPMKYFNITQEIDNNISKDKFMELLMNEYNDYCREFINKPWNLKNEALNTVN